MRPETSPLKEPSFVTIRTTSGRVFLRFCVCALLMPGMVLSVQSATAAELTSLKVGYQRQALVGGWFPVTVTASGLTQGHSVSLLVFARDARGNQVAETCASDAVAADGSVRLRGLTRTGRLDGSLRVELIDSETSETLCGSTVQCTSLPLTDEAKSVQKTLRLYRHEVRFLLTIGMPAGVDELVARAADISPESPAIVGLSVPSVEDLPVDQREYEMFDSLVLSGNVELSPQQFDAIREWVGLGGQLLIGCSDQVGDLLAAPFGQWLDGHFGLESETRQVTDADLRSIQQMVPQSTRISTFRRNVNMAQIRSDQPLVLAGSANGPLVARTGSGGGSLTFVAVNLTTRPLSQWKSLGDFYGILLLGAPVSKVQTRAGSSRISSSGIGDLTTQLMATIDPIPGTGRWSAWSVIALSFGWLILIGPVDYLVVVVLLKRPHLTWITFPLWVVIAFAALYSLKSGDADVILDTVHVVDVTEEGRQNAVRCTSLMSMSVPETTRVSLKAAPNQGLCEAAASSSAVFTWTGRPDDVYGGMYRATGIGAGSQRYALDAAESSVISSVPMLVDGSFEAQASWQAVSEAPLVESSLSVSGFGLLAGSFTHHLSTPLRDWVVVFGKRIYQAKDDARASLPGGQPWEFQRGSALISDLKSYLTGPRPARVAPSGGVAAQTITSTPYSSSGRDPLDIGTIMSLYEVAGGKDYTGLNHDALRRLDVSDSIRLNYALVIGWTDTPATQLEMDGAAVPETASNTIVRLLIPVDRRPADPGAMTSEDLKKDSESSDEDPSTDDEADDSNQEPSP